MSKKNETPKCEYRDCKEKAFTKFLSTWLCKEHYLTVLSVLGFRRGRKRIDTEKILRWLENKTFITISDFKRDFNVTYTTACRYLNFLEEQGFIERMGSGWRVSDKKNKVIVSESIER